MRFIVYLFTLFIPAAVFAQPARDTNAAYLKTKDYPNIQLLLADSTTVFTKADLPKDKTVAIVFFSPECEHCQHTAEILKNKMDSLTNLFMVWNANMVDNFSLVKEFYYKYGFNKYSNIKMGKEINYYLPVYYMIETTPYCAIYKNGKLFTEFRGNVEAADLIAVANNTYTPPPPIKVDKKKVKRKAKK